MQRSTGRSQREERDRQNISMTETRQFRRLVTFLSDIDSLARINADDELQALVDECRSDLLGQEAA